VNFKAKFACRLSHRRNHCPLSATGNSIRPSEHDHDFVPLRDEVPQYGNSRPGCSSQKQLHGV
jgi:hypothetical protein